MGVAVGRFLPNEAYAAIQPLVVVRRDSSQAHLNLAVRLSDGTELPAQGGVLIRDYSADLGAESLEVEVLGIGYPLYEELFPDHVARYRSRFA